MNETDAVHATTVFAQNCGCTAHVVTVAVSCQKRGEAFDPHALQELQADPISRAAVNNNCRSISDKDNLTRALRHIEKEDFHFQPLRPPLLSVY